MTLKPALMPAEESAAECHKSTSSTCHRIELPTTP
jgi:hypothetical protein